MTRRRRHLSAEEKAIWETIARQTRPLSPRTKTAANTAPKPGPDSRKTVREAEDGQTPIAPFNIGEQVDHSRTNDLIPGLGQQMNKAPVRMDSKSFGRL